MSESFLVTPWQLKHLSLPNRLIQGPLAGVSCAPFRQLAQRYGEPAYSCSEMISAHDICKHPARMRRYLWRAPEEKFVCYQLAATEPGLLAQACETLSDNANIIDLNCGCPVPKIRRKHQGSHLLTDPEKLHQLVCTMRAHTKAVVSVKIRTGSPANDSIDSEVVSAIESAGADLLIVHGRHWTQKYDVPSQSDAIARIKQMTSLPVVANGDAHDAKSAKVLQKYTKCDAVMIARAGMGNPWVFSQIKSELAGKIFTEPSHEQIGAAFITHLSGLAELTSEREAALQSRKFAKYYARNHPQQETFVSCMQQTQSLQHVIDTIKNFMGSNLQSRLFD